MHLTSDEYAMMGLAIQNGQGFEAAVARGVPDTPENRAAFARLKAELADMERRGVKPEWPFD